MAFYNHALLATKLGRDRIAQLGIPIKRPTDYFCEHVKSDAHMNKVNFTNKINFLNFTLILKNIIPHFLDQR